MMASSSEKRSSRRYQHDTAIMYAHYKSGRYFEGRMFNYSRGGMYLESNHAPETGAEIFIGVENSPHTSGHDVYRAKVVWRTKLEDAKSFFSHGFGVKLF